MAIAGSRCSGAVAARKMRSKGLRDLEKAVNAGLETAAASMFRCQLHVARQALDLAIADCNEAIRRDLQSAVAYAARGAAYFAKGDYDHSLASAGGRHEESGRRHDFRFTLRGVSSEELDDDADRE